MPLNKNKIIILILSAGFFFTSVSVYSFNAAKDYFVATKNESLSAENQSQYSVSSTNNITSNLKKHVNLKVEEPLPFQKPENVSNADTTVFATSQNSSLNDKNNKPNNEIEVKIIENNQQSNQSSRGEPVSPLNDAKNPLVATQSQNNPKPVEATPTLPLTEIKNETKSQPNENPEIIKYKTFEGSQWKEVYEKAKLSYENITNNYEGLNYFGADNVNQVAIDLATKRGFTKRSLVADQSKLVNVEGYLIQPKMADSIKELFKEMRDNGLSIIFLSGFRGIPEQSTVFGEEFYKQSIINRSREVSNQEILDRKADGVFNKSYDTVALPGYSRHHYGYTIDVTEPGTYYKSFESTKAYEWMSKDNFYNVKKHGLIPSYPKGVDYQGPEPESWEFVYVGKENLLR
jgi:D-alanyl-D-alanine carboxypeptidase